MGEHLHQRTAVSLLATVWSAGQHHLVEPDDWPDALPAAVLGAIHQALAINSDPTMHNFRDTGESREQHSHVASLLAKRP
ncbi:hypothetical protein ACH4GP_32195 [Streptomyces celluloflavus]|uniref:Uncharacterized protein n=1 Tax=Streptomyces celluloflavus TaxID=58344 RepID=A0ABW7RLM8_9ACTN